VLATKNHDFRLKISLQWNKCRATIDHVLEKPNHTFREVIRKIPKIYNLFIWYLNNTFFSGLESS
jgi:hypothetical protein